MTPRGDAGSLACDMRAAVMRGKALLFNVVQSMFHVAGTLQTPPVITSAALALGRLKAVKPVALPHQLKPRRSPPCP